MSTWKINGNDDDDDCAWYQNDANNVDFTLPRLGVASNLVFLASASSSLHLPLPCLASVKDISVLPRLNLDLSALTSASASTALSPSLDYDDLKSQRSIIASRRQFYACLPGRFSVARVTSHTSSKVRGQGQLSWQLIPWPKISCIFGMGTPVTNFKLGIYGWSIDVRYDLEAESSGSSHRLHHHHHHHHPRHF